MNRGEGRRAGARLTDLEAKALCYVALPNVIFLAGWIVSPLGPLAAVAVAALVGWTLVRQARPGSDPGPRVWVGAIGVAFVWCLLGGEGHFLYANSDWWVRDAVLLDLVRDPWPVTYHVDDVDLVLRTPIGFYLPAAVVGKLFGVRVAELAFFAWTAAGVAMVFAMMLRDRPGPVAAAIRIVVFVAFSGMDILPTIGRDYPHEIGAMIEWWARFLSYSSATTLLFWAPNHTLPGWIATAWLLGQKPRELHVPIAALFVVLMPISAPLTALGLAPIVAVAIGHRLWVDRGAGVLAHVVDLRVLVVAALCIALVFPYLVAGAGKVDAGLMADIPWVGEEYGLRYIEFVLVEFVGIAVLLLTRRPRDPLLWAAVAVLFALPIVRFGPYNDLAMRGSIPALALLAIHAGLWLSVPLAKTNDLAARLAIVGLLAVGAVTPFMEIARVFIAPRWDMNVRASLVEVTRGTHYLTPLHEPWLDRFLAKP